MIKLAKLLAKDKKLVYTYAMEKAQELYPYETIIHCQSLQEIKQNAEVIIAPIPFSSDGSFVNTPFSQKPLKIEELFEVLENKEIFAGAISSEIQERAQKKHIKIIDLMEEEELTILNTIATAEGAIQVAISNTEINLQGSKILILGFGRVAKMVAKKCKQLDANVTCAARKEQDMTWIKTYGYEAMDIRTMGQNLNQYDIIINTVPHIIITKEHMPYIQQDCLLMDLASKPGGFEREQIQKYNFNYVWALALPGKVAPTTTAKFIKDTLYHILKRKKEKQ